MKDWGDGGMRLCPGVSGTYAHYVERACFIEPSNWNEVTDGPLPRCYTYVP